MLAVLAPPGAGLDAGSVGLALARRWSESAGRALFVDVDTTGSRLAQRYGAATRAEYSPAVRGMPSLIVAREPLELKTLADHCYSLGDSQGSLWALFAPFNVQAGVYAAGWLTERAEALAAVDRYRSVVLAASLSGASLLAPLLKSCAVAVVVAPVESRESAAALWIMCRDAGLMGFERGHRLLIVEGSSPLGDDEILAEAGMHVAGRIPAVDDERLLLGTHDGFLIAVNALTGRPINSFGVDGKSDLHTAVPRATRGNLPLFSNEGHTVSPNSPPVVVRDTVISGAAMSDRPTLKEWPPGSVQGFDVRPGDLKWVFHTIPQAGEFGEHTWDDGSNLNTGNANVWSTLSGDDELGHVYLATTAPTNDYWACSVGSRCRRDRWARR